MKLRQQNEVSRRTSAVPALAVSSLILSIISAPGTTPGLSWPPPPDPARIRFVQIITGPKDLGIRRSFWGRAADLITGKSRSMPMERPFGVSVASDGSLLVADTSANAVYWFDKAHQTFRRWEQIGPYRFEAPVSVAQDKDVLYVADSALPAVLGFDAKGRLLYALTNDFQRPTGLTIVGDELFVSDAGAHRICVYDLKGRELRRFGSRGTEPGQFNFPTHLGSDREGHLVVTDSMNSRIQLLDRNGGPLGTIGSPGDASGHFGRPKGVGVDTDGHVYVSDALFDNIQVFEPSGGLLLHFGQAGQGPGEFWMPNGIAIGPDDRIYVADTYNHRIQVFEYVRRQ